MLVLKTVVWRKVLTGKYGESDIQYFRQITVNRYFQPPPSNIMYRQLTNTGNHPVYRENAASPSLRICWIYISAKKGHTVRISFAYTPVCEKLEKPKKEKTP